MVERKPRCSKRKCEKIASQPSGLCRQHLQAECDRLFSLKVREVGECQSGRQNHAGGHQCAHGFSRRFLSIRWNPNNAWCFCAGCHKFYTENPDQWSWWLLDRWGQELFDAMRAMAQQTLVKVDMEAVFAGLRSDTT